MNNFRHQVSKLLVNCLLWHFCICHLWCLMAHNYLVLRMS